MITADRYDFLRIREDKPSGKYLGKDLHGYSYRLLPDGYVYNYRPNGTRVGYLCDAGAWERTYHTMITEKP